MKRIWHAYAAFRARNQGYFQRCEAQIAQNNLRMLQAALWVLLPFFLLYGIWTTITMRNPLLIACYAAIYAALLGLFALTRRFRRQPPAPRTVQAACYLCVCMLMAFIITISIFPFPKQPALFYSLCYIIVATLGAPVLIKMGVPVIAAHMFVFYYAILSVVTPPVCLAAFSGAAIAEADAMRTGFISMKLAVVAFIVPFFFVLQPSLLMQGSAMDVTQAIVTSIIAMYALAGAMQGYLLITANIIERAALLTGGLTMLYPGTLTDLVGLGCLIGVLALQLARRKFAHTATV